MKMLVISNMYPNERYPFRGTFVKNSVQGLREEGVQVDTLYPDFKDNDFLNKLQVYFVFFKNVFSMLWNDSGKYDVVYFHYANHSLIPLVFIPKKRMAGNKLILNFHGGDLLPENFKNKILQKLTSRVYGRFDAYVVPSEYYGVLLRNIYGNKYSIAYDDVIISASGGIDTFSFKDFNHDREYTFGFVSRLVSGKGWKTYLLALNKLNNEKVLSFSAVVVGDGEDRDECVDLIEKLGLDGKVTYMGSVGHDKLPGILNKIQCFVFPSERKSESLGLIGLEAMACGCFVISSDIGGIPSYLEDGYNGLLFEPGNIVALHDRMTQYLSMPEVEKREKISHANITSRNYSSKSVNRELAIKIDRVAN